MRTKVFLQYEYLVEMTHFIYELFNIDLRIIRVGLKKINQQINILGSHQNNVLGYVTKVS